MYINKHNHLSDCQTVSYFYEKFALHCVINQKFKKFRIVFYRIKKNHPKIVKAFQVIMPAYRKIVFEV